MSIALTIVTPEGEAFAGNVEQVVLPGSEGEFGVLEQHERTLTPLQAGSVRIEGEGGTRWAAVTDGFADVSSEQVIVMVERCRRAEDIDTADVERERSRLEAQLQELTGSARDLAIKGEIESQLTFLALQSEIATKQAAP